MPDLELITSIICPFAQRSRIALAEKGLSFKSTEIKFLGDRFEKPDWFRALTPYRTVPVLKYGEDVIYDSDVVNQYIEDVFPEPPLMPSSPAGRAAARLWLTHSNSKFLRGYYGVIMSQTEERVDRYREQFHETLRFMEREGIGKLGADGPFWMGAQMTLVDISYFPFFERFGMLDHYRGFHLPDDCSRLQKWYDAMRARPSVASTIESDDFHIDVYTHYAKGTQVGVTAREMSEVLAS